MRAEEEEELDRDADCRDENAFCIMIVASLWHSARVFQVAMDSIQL